MARVNDRYAKRSIKCLDGSWVMRVDGGNVGMNGKWYESPLTTDTRTTAVPSVWATHKDLFTYEGAIWYEKEFYFDGGCLFLSFGAAMTEADVWLDGNYLGNHYGGFCEFDFKVDDVSEGYHRLTVRVDNHFDAYSIPQTYVDWYHHGGIVRSIYAHKLSGVAVISNKFDYTLSDDLTAAACSFEIELYNTNAETTETTLTLKIGDVVRTENVAVDARAYKTVTISDLKLDNIKLWDIGKGNLYTVTTSTDNDVLYDRVGFRQIEVKDKKILLNGREIEVMGVNRHEEHPELGFAFPQSLMDRDLALITEMGCNFVRGSHYPNSHEFIDLLDERGIMFWSEIPIWGCGFSEQTLGEPKVVERGLEMHREMLKYYYNHASIVMWGMHNEILANTQAGYDMSKCYYEFLKANGGNRLVVYASHIPSMDISLEFTDVICLNQYHGWYIGDLNSWQGVLDRFSARQKELGLDDKPIIMSEFGAAAVYGCHDNDDFLWTEEYQARLIEHCLNLFHSYPGVIGSLIWQFADARTSKEAGISRARRFNNKGLINEYRKPKLAYFAAQKCFKKFAEEKGE